MGDRLAAGIRERALELLTGLCAVSSESGNVAGLEAVAERLRAELAQHGLDARIERCDGQPALVAGRGARRPVLFVGHIDTVLPAGHPVMEGDRLRATGALDSKGGLVAFLAALDVLAARGARLPSLELLAVPDEEVGGSISQRLTRLHAERAAVVLVLEPGEGRGAGETVVLGRRGLTEWSLVVAGAAAHSGLAYWDGRSALLAAAEWVQAAAALSETGRGPTVNVARLIAGSENWVERLDQSAGMLGTSRERNVVPDRARAEGEVRYLAAADGPRVVARLQRAAAEIAARHRTEIVFATGDSLPPVDPNGPGAMLARRAVALAAQRGWMLEIEEDRGGVSFPNFLPDPAALPVLDGLGPVGGGMHTRDEFVDLASLERRILLLADLLEDLAR